MLLADHLDFGTAQRRQDGVGDFGIDVRHLADLLLTHVVVGLGAHHVEDLVLLGDVRFLDGGLEAVPVLTLGVVHILEDGLLEVLHLDVVTLGIALQVGVELVVEPVLAHLETTLGEALVVGLLAFGGGPAGDHHTVDDVVVIHELDELVDGVLGGLGLVVGVVPVHVRTVEVEEEGGGAPDELGLVVVGREQEGGAAAGIVGQPRGEVGAGAGVADALAKVAVAEVMVLLLQVGRRTGHDVGGLVALVELEGAGLGEAAAGLVGDGDAVALGLLALERDGGKRRRNLLTVNGKRRRERHRGLLLHVFWRDGSLDGVGHLAALVL